MAEEESPPPDTGGDPDEPGLYAGYHGRGRQRPAYAGLIGLYSALFAGFLLTAKSARAPLPERPPWDGLLLLGVAPHKMSRLLTTDWVTSALRAPFTEYEGSGEGPTAVKEKPRGKGLRYAVGELLTCPWCLDQWVAALFVFALP